MAKNNFLIRKLLRLITPEEITEIATKHSEGGRFISMTELLKERVLQKIYRDFTKLEMIDEILDKHNEKLKKQFHKNLDFDQSQDELAALRAQREEDNELAKISPAINVQMRATSQVKENEDFIELNGHIKNDDGVENMSSFIINEKERMKKSQYVLKQKEILTLYEKNSNIDVSEVKIENKNPGTIGHKGILINKKQ